jgi:hypothetical protein
MTEMSEREKQIAFIKAAIDANVVSEAQLLAMTWLAAADSYSDATVTAAVSLFREARQKGPPPHGRPSLHLVS